MKIGAKTHWYIILDDTSKGSNPFTSAMRRQIYMVVCWGFSGTLFFGAMFVPMPTLFRVWALGAGLFLILVNFVISSQKRADDDLVDWLGSDEYHEELRDRISKLWWEHLSVLEWRLREGELVKPQELPSVTYMGVSYLCKASNMRVKFSPRCYPYFKWVESSAVSLSAQ